MYIFEFNVGRNNHCTHFYVNTHEEAIEAAKQYFFDLMRDYHEPDTMNLYIANKIYFPEDNFKENWLKEFKEIAGQEEKKRVEEKELVELKRLQEKYKNKI